jgi:hypothetical protein
VTSLERASLIALIASWHFIAITTAIALYIHKKDIVYLFLTAPSRGIPLRQFSGAAAKDFLEHAGEFLQLKLLAKQRVFTDS